MAIRKRRFPTTHTDPTKFRSSSNAGWGEDSATIRRTRVTPSGRGAVVFIGQSNIEGAESDYTVKPYTDDAPNPNVLEVSRGVARTDFRVPAAGVPMVAREPAQDDSGGMGPKKGVCERLLNMDIGLDRMYFFAGATGGTGFDDDTWKTTSTALTTLIAEMNVFFDAHPEVPILAFVWAQGAQDAVVGMDRATYEGHVTALAAKLRDEVTGAADSLWISVGTHPNLIVENFGSTPALPTSRFGGGTYYDIDEAQRGVADTVPNAVYLRMDDVRDTDDGRHFTSAGFRIMEHRIAEMIAREAISRERTVTPPTRMVSTGGPFFDAYGGGFQVFGAPTIEDDPDLGACIRINGSGYDTDLLLQPTGGYTKFLRIKPMVVVPAADWALVSGKNDATDDLDIKGHFWSIRLTGHTAGSNFSLSPGTDSNLVNGVASSLCLVWSEADAAFTMYIDGVEEAMSVVGTGGGEPPTEPLTVEIGSWNEDSIGDYRVTDFGVLPWQATAADVLAWHNNGPGYIGPFGGK